MPFEGDQFDVIGYASATSDFLSVTTDVEGEDPDGLEWSGSAGANSYVLTVIRP